MTHLCPRSLSLLVVVVGYNAGDVLSVVAHVFRLELSVHNDRLEHTHRLVVSVCDHLGGGAIIDLLI